MQVIIPVAGKGTRMRPHTHTTAKPLMHVAGKTVLQHILDRLKNLPITEVIFVTGHLGKQFDSLKLPWPTRTNGTARHCTRNSNGAAVRARASAHHFC